MAYRYFSTEALPAVFEPPFVFVLGGDEAHHLLNVMRVKCGEPLVLFDGSGAEYDTEIVALGKRDLTVQLLARREVSREAEVALTLAVALPKGDRQKWLIEKLVELGAAAFWPLEAERSVAKAEKSVLERLRRTVVEASKQCGRNTLMEIGEPISTRQLFGDSERTAGFSGRFLAHPGGEMVSEQRNALEAAPLKILAAVGPEGGFSEAEIAAALAAGWKSSALGNRILRTETAALALAALWNLR